MKNKRNIINFIIKGLIFLLILIVIIAGLIILSSSNETFNKIFAWISNSEEYNRSEEVEKEKALEGTLDKENGYTKIIVGDSVSWFLFNRVQNQTDVYFMGGTSRPFTIAGQYVQIKQFLETHPEATEVYMFESKATWESVIDPQNAYQNLAVPLVATDSFETLDEDTQKEFYDMFGAALLSKPIVQVYDYSNMNRKLVLNGITKYHSEILGEDMEATYWSTENELSPITKRYLPKIIALCEKNNVELHILHDPLADTESKRMEYELEKKMFEDAGYSNNKYIEEYLNSVIFYPEECFFDGVHIILVDAFENGVIEDLKQKTGLLQDLELE